MSLSLFYVLLTVAIVVVAFLIGNRVRGPAFALAAAGLAFVGMFALFLVTVMFITSSVP